MESLINSKDVKIKLPSKFPPVRRDISVLVDKNISVGEMVSTVSAQVIDGVIDFYPFDIYEGKGIENDKKSIAFLILIQDTYKTLEDEEVNNIVSKVLNTLQKKFKASLR